MSYILVKKEADIKNKEGVSVRMFKTLAEASCFAQNDGAKCISESKYAKIEGDKVIEYEVLETDGAITPVPVPLKKTKYSVIIGIELPGMLSDLIRPIWTDLKIDGRNAEKDGWFRRCIQYITFEDPKIAVVNGLKSLINNEALDVSIRSAAYRFWHVIEERIFDICDKSYDSHISEPATSLVYITLDIKEIKEDEEG